MAEWLFNLRLQSPRHDVFARALISEEEAKIERLSKFARETGLPIYESSRFKLPSQEHDFLRECRRITGIQQWRLAVRVSLSNASRVVFRGLDISVEEACSALRRLPRDDSYIVAVSPYRTPARSGTIRIANGHAEMEFAFGPHTILSKGHAAENELFYCTYGPFSPSIKYSTPDRKLRELLFSAFSQTTRLVLGCSLKDSVRCHLAAYAEFHWHEDIGFRFIECSFSPVWTGERV